MRDEDQIIEITISQIDLYVIEKVKELRKKQNIAQAHLSVLMGVAEKFVGNVENPNYPSKYNIRHLNLIAQALKCPVTAIIPEKALPNDAVIAFYKKIYKINKDGIKSKKHEYKLVSFKPDNQSTS